MPSLIQNQSKVGSNILETIIRIVSHAFCVSMVGVSSVDKGTESDIVSLGTKEKQRVATLTSQVFHQKGYYVATGKNSEEKKVLESLEIKFFVGVAIPNEQKMSLCLWIKDVNKHDFSDKDLEILINFVTVVSHLLTCSTKITSRDAKSLIEVQKELFVSNRKLAESNARRKAMLENIGDGIIGVDDKGTIIYANPQVTKLTGWKQDELAGKMLVHALTLENEEGEELEVNEHPIRNALYHNKKVVDNKNYYKRKNGTRFAVAITATPVLLNSQIFGGINVFRDISEERAIDRMKTEFISLASHQLRTPLSSMKWFCDMLLDGDAGDLNEEQRELTESVYRSNERMIALVNTLLNISRIESGRIIVEPVQTNVKELIEGVIEEVQPRIQKKKHNVSVNASEDVPMVNVDPRLARNVYLNLVTNAVKYTPDGGEIKIDIFKKEKDVVVKITDNGLGIPKDANDRIFSKFFRAENVLKVETEGTGLGLYLVKIVVDTLEGKIWFESEEGKGTCFTFTLPIEGVKPKKGEVTIS